MPNISLNIASTALDAAQTAMDTISQNLSNTNTPGYVAETANLVTNPGGDRLGVGDGVRVTSVSQPADALLEANAHQTEAGLAQTTALQQVLQQAQLAFQEPSSNGLSADLSSFWQGWDQIAANPTDPAARQEVVDGAQTLVSDLNQASQQLTTTEANTSAQLSSVVTEANTALGEVATLNQQITATQTSGVSANSLIDQRNQLMNQLATDIGATGTVASDGSVQVDVGGVSLVSGNWHDTITLVGSGTSTKVMTQATNATVPMSSGTAAGLLAATTQYLPAFQNQLDSVANDLAGVVNTQLAAGYTATGAAGVPLFSGTGAAGLAVNPAIVSNPQLIAASATNASPASTNDGSNAQAVANLWDSPSGPDSAYQSLVQYVGDQVKTVNNQVQSQTSVNNAAQQNLQAVTGVDQNTQLVNLINFQQAFQAAAKVISTVDNTMQSLLAAV